MIAHWAGRARCPACSHRFSIGGDTLPEVGRTLLACLNCLRVAPYLPEPPDEVWWEYVLRETEE